MPYSPSRMVQSRNFIAALFPTVMEFHIPLQPKNTFLPVASPEAENTVPAPTTIVAPGSSRTVQRTMVTSALNVAIPVTRIFWLLKTAGEEIVWLFQVTWKVGRLLQSCDKQSVGDSRMIAKKKVSWIVRFALSWVSGERWAVSGERWNYSNCA